VREAHLASAGSPADYTLSTPARKLAAIAHLRGFEAKQKCQSCQDGRGSYAECVMVDCHLAGGCTNCYHDEDLPKIYQV
jgi:hypothetical protein